MAVHDLKKDRKTNSVPTHAVIDLSVRRGRILHSFLNERGLITGQKFSVRLHLGRSISPAEIIDIDG